MKREKTIKKERVMRTPKKNKELIRQDAVNEHVVKRFIADCCEEKTDGKAIAKDMWSAYNRWAEQNNERVMSARIFYDTLRRLGYSVRCAEDNLAHVFGLIIS